MITTLVANAKADMLVPVLQHRGQCAAGSQGELAAEAQPEEPCNQGSSGAPYPKAQDLQVSLGLSLGEGAPAGGRGARKQQKPQTTSWA